MKTSSIRRALRIARMRRAALAARACFFIAAAAAAAPAAGGDEATQRGNRACTEVGIANAWRVLRRVECARCHGRDSTGLAAPSIVAYAATQSRESFTRIVIDGDPVRGMPGYRDNAYVTENL